MSLDQPALDSGYTDLPSLGSKSRMGHIPQRPRLPSYWARMHPQGQAGLRAGKTGLPAPPHPNTHQAGVRGFRRGGSQELEVSSFPHLRTKEGREELLACEEHGLMGWWRHF